MGCRSSTCDAYETAEHRYATGVRNCDDRRADSHGSTVRSAEKIASKPAGPAWLVAIPLAMTA